MRGFVRASLSTSQEAIRRARSNPQSNPRRPCRGGGIRRASCGNSNFQAWASRCSSMRLEGDFVEGFAGVDALDDLLDRLVFDEQVANFNGIENLTNQIRSGNFHAVEANPISELVDLFEFEAISRDG